MRKHSVERTFFVVFIAVKHLIAGVENFVLNLVMNTYFVFFYVSFTSGERLRRKMSFEYSDKILFSQIENILFLTFKLL